MDMAATAGMSSQVKVFKPWLARRTVRRGKVAEAA